MLAAKMGISEHTIGNMLRDIYRIVNVGTRAGLVKYLLTNPTFDCKKTPVRT